MALGKYEFNNKDQALAKIAKLGIEHNHSVVALGYLILTEGVYNEQGEVITEPIKSSRYAVDVLWSGLESHPYGWGFYSVNVKNPKHSFSGVGNNTQL
tara:strand:- start:350 stop:643 length:294 start_codon:yes stop_codon:yes gene_type:complete